MYDVYIFQYSNHKDGRKLWKFQAYLGPDPITSKPVKKTRSNFRSKKEAQIALAQLQTNFENNNQKS